MAKNVDDGGVNDDDEDDNDLNGDDNDLDYADNDDQLMIRTSSPPPLSRLASSSLSPLCHRRHCNHNQD